MIHELIKIANQLDAKGYCHLANEVDMLIKIAVSRSDLIRALKNDDRKEARKALTTFIRNIPYGSTPQRELGMTDDEYRDFVNYIRIGELRQARKIFGIGEKKDFSKFLATFVRDFAKFVTLSSGNVVKGKCGVEIPLLPSRSDRLIDLIKNLGYIKDQYGTYYKPSTVGKPLYEDKYGIYLIALSLHLTKEWLDWYRAGQSDNEVHRLVHPKYKSLHMYIDVIGQHGIVGKFDEEICDEILGAI